MDIGDTERIQSDVQAINEVWDTEVTLEEFDYMGMKGYVMSWDSGSYTDTRVYEPVQGSETYLLIDIIDHGKDHNVWELVNTYCLDLENIP